MQVPFTVWVLKNFFDAVPRSIFEAARLDGASRARTLWTIVLPIVAPGLGATAIFNLAAYWSEFSLALVLLDSQERYHDAARPVQLSERLRDRLAAARRGELHRARAGASPAFVLPATLLRRRPHRRRGQRVTTTHARYPRRLAHALGSRVVSDARAVPLQARRARRSAAGSARRRSGTTSTSISTARRSCSRTTSRSGPSRSRGCGSAIEDGRILIGPWYVMPDEFLVSGESLVRNLVARPPHLARVRHADAGRLPAGSVRPRRPDAADLAAVRPRQHRSCGAASAARTPSTGGTRRTARAC